MFRTRAVHMLLPGAPPDRTPANPECLTAFVLQYTKNP